MSLQRLDLDDRQAVMYSEGSVCASTQELVESATFARVLDLYVDHLEAHNPQALDELGLAGAEWAGPGGEPASTAADPRRERLLDLIRLLANNPLERVSITACASGDLSARREQLHEFVEGLYDFWRRWDRFLVVRAELPPAPGDKRPLRGFTETVESLARLVRALYRDVAENVTGTRPRVLRQVAAGAEVGVYAVRHRWQVPASYRDLLTGIPFVRDLLLYPPLLLDPPMNTRTGQFTEVAENPLDGLKLEREEWLCYPALVGRMTVFVYFHRRFMGLGLALANLFEVASDEEIAAGPDAVYLYGVPPAALARFGDLPTVFHDDRGSRLLVAAVPLEDRFGYFGYLKKMVLTLHNVAAMDRGVMPFHGAYARLVLVDGTRATVLLIGDTATGKSETLEALRVTGEDRIREVRIIADDMGSLEVGAGRRAARVRHRDRRLRAPRRPAAGLRVRPAGPLDHHEPQQGQRAGGAPGHHSGRRAPRPPRGLPAVRQQLRGCRRGASGGRPPDRRTGRARRLPGRRGHEQGHHHLHRHHQQLLRQPVRPGPAPGAA